MAQCLWFDHQEEQRGGGVEQRTKNTLKANKNTGICSQIDLKYNTNQKYFEDYMEEQNTNNDH